MGSKPIPWKDIAFFFGGVVVTALGTMFGPQSLLWQVSAAIGIGAMLFSLAHASFGGFLSAKRHRLAGIMIATVLVAVLAFCLLHEQVEAMKAAKPPHGAPITAAASKAAPALSGTTAEQEPHRTSSPISSKPVQFVHGRWPIGEASEQAAPNNQAVIYPKEIWEHNVESGEAIEIDVRNIGKVRGDIPAHHTRIIPVVGAIDRDAIERNLNEISRDAVNTATSRAPSGLIEVEETLRLSPDIVVDKAEWSEVESSSLNVMLCVALAYRDANAARNTLRVTGWCGLRDAPNVYLIKRRRIALYSDKGEKISEER